MRCSCSSDANAARHLHFDGQGRQLADQRAHQRALASAVAPEHADAGRPPDRQLDAAQHDALAVAGVERFGAQHRIGAVADLVQREVDSPQFAHGRHLGHPLERLDAALHLARLRRLRAKAFDERVQVIDALLLRRALALGLHPALRAQSLEGAVAARVAHQLRVVQMQCRGGDAIEEIAVVRDDDDRSRIAQQPALEPQDRVEVEMVGRLVEQQQLARREQRARQVQPHAPAARQRVDRRRRLRRVEAQAGQQRARARLGARASRVEPAFVRERDRDAVARVLCRVQRLGGRAQRLVAGDQEAPGRQRTRRQRLLEAHRRAPGLREVAAVGQRFAGKRGEQGRLAAAVAADQRDAFAGRDRCARAIEQDPPAARQRDAVEADHAGNGSAAASISTSSCSPAAVGR